MGVAGGADAVALLGRRTSLGRLTAGGGSSVRATERASAEREACGADGPGGEGCGEEGSPGGSVADDTCRGAAGCRGAGAASAMRGGSSLGAAEASGAVESSAAARGAGAAEVTRGEDALVVLVRRTSLGRLTAATGGVVASAAGSGSSVRAAERDSTEDSGAPGLGGTAPFLVAMGLGMARTPRITPAGSTGGCSTREPSSLFTDSTRKDSRDASAGGVTRRPRARSTSRRTPRAGRRRTSVRCWRVGVLMPARPRSG